MARGLALRPVHSVKNVVDVATSTVLALTSIVPIIETVDVVNLASPTEVSVGSTIKAIFLRVEVLATGVFAGVPRVYMAVYKNPAGNLGFLNANAVGTDDRKRFVFHEEMTMVTEPGASTSSLPRTMFQGVIRIPQRFRRFGHDDQLDVILQNGSGETSGIANVCVQAIYKWFS